MLSGESSGSGVVVGYRSGQDASITGGALRGVARDFCRVRMDCPLAARARSGTSFREFRVEQPGKLPITAARIEFWPIQFSAIDSRNYYPTRPDGRAKKEERRDDKGCGRLMSISNAD